MTMQRYVAPRMECEELTLFEAIANNCWSGKNFYFNADGDDELDEYFLYTERLFVEKGGCSEKRGGYVLEEIRVRWFPFSPKRFKQWKIDSKANQADVLNNTNVDQIVGYSGCNWPKK